MAVTVRWEEHGKGYFSGKHHGMFLEIKRIPQSTRFSVFVDNIKLAEVGSVNAAKTKATKFAENPLAAKAAKITIDPKKPVSLARRPTEDKPAAVKMDPSWPTASATPPKAAQSAEELEDRLREQWSLGANSRPSTPLQMSAPRAPARTTSTVTVERRRLELPNKPVKQTVTANVNFMCELNTLSADEVQRLINRVVAEIRAHGGEAIAECDMKLNLGI